MKMSEEEIVDLLASHGSVEEAEAEENNESFDDREEL